MTIATMTAMAVIIVIAIVTTETTDTSIENGNGSIFSYINLRIIWPASPSHGGGAKFQGANLDFCCEEAVMFCGIDLHSNNKVVVVTDETDRVLISRRCPNELTQILCYSNHIVENCSASWSSLRTTGIGWSTA
jgi:hypothetical protein